MRNGGHTLVDFNDKLTRYLNSLIADAIRGFHFSMPLSNAFNIHADFNFVFFAHRQRFAKIS